MHISAALRLIDPTPQARDAWLDLSDAQRAQIAQRRSIVAAWRSRCQSFRAAGRKTADATQTILDENPGLSQTTLYRWARLAADTDVTALLDRRSDKAVRQVASQPTIGELAWSRFKQLYLTIQGRSVATCHLVVSEEATKHAGDPAWSWPSLRAVQLAVSRIPPTQRDFHRLGEREWRRHYEPDVPRDYQQYRPGEYWVGDFHEMDVFCRRSETDPTIVRPLLGSFIDLRSRMIMGWHIGETENADAVLLTLADGIRAHGVPWHVVIDNGKPYKASGVSGGRPKATRLIADEEGFKKRIAVLPGLEIAVHFSIPFNPNSKLIERWHGTLEEQFGKLLDTYCGGQKDDRFRIAYKLAHEEPDKCPTIDELRTKFGLYLEGYHVTPHQGEAMEGRPPALVFEQDNPIPRSVLPDQVLEFMLLRVVGPTKDGDALRYIKVGKNGIRYQGIDYGSTDPRLEEWKGREVTLRVHPADASFVWVCDTAGAPICKAINNRLALAGASREDVSKGMKNKARARRFARQAREGAALPALDSVVDAALKARRDRGERAMEKLIAATGTNDAVAGHQPPTTNHQPRTVAPLRSDLAELSHRLANNVDRPPAEQPRRSITDIAASFEPLDTPAPTKPRRSLTDIFGGGQSA